MLQLRSELEQYKASDLDGGYNVEGSRVSCGIWSDGGGDWRLIWVSKDF